MRRRDARKRSDERYGVRYEFGGWPRDDNDMGRVGEEFAELRGGSRAYPTMSQSCEHIVEFYVRAVRNRDPGATKDP